MYHIPHHITTVIFDLGGVIIDLAPERTLTAFATLVNKPVPEILTVYTTHPVFPAHETGRIGDDEFRNTIRTLFNLNAGDAEIDRCWNAMLVNLPAEKLAMLNRLKKHFTTLVLSNTNPIHLAHINNNMLSGHSLDAYVHHACYSHELGMRKPDYEIFDYVLTSHALIPEHTFFLDDNPDNIRAAKACGMETLLIEHPVRVTDLFKNYA
ncbi:MAG TPA: HAD family phosphatase [Cyclobacteriaceae bacterium]|nr:HAD family phosphatase [Cyclobacteriaceae bacterium]